MSTDTTSTQNAAQKPRRFTISKQGLTAIRLTVSYIVLVLGAMFMLFPIVWMISASLKPDWQIFAQPIIWIPQEWLNTPAGDTGQLLNLWVAPIEEGELQDVLRLSARRYMPVIPVDDLPALFSTPQEQLSDATLKTADDITLNVRRWEDEGDGLEVVALARDGDNLLIVPREQLQNLLVLPLDQINAGERSSYMLGDYELQSRIVTLADGETQEIVQLGPQFQMVIVTPAEAAQEVFLVPAAEAQSAGLQPLGQTEIQLRTLQDDPDTYYVMLNQAAWSPILDEDTLRAHTFSVPLSELALEEPQEFNQAWFQVGVYTSAGEDQEVAVLLVDEENLALVIPTVELGNVRIAPMDTLLRPFPEDVNGVYVRLKEYTLDGEELQVGIIGDRQDMVMLIPAEAVSDAYDIPGEQVERKMRTNLLVENYVEAMSSELADENFITFFKNSIIIVALNIIGHLLSCTVAAYGFARLRAPGRNILFWIVLGTMMLPFPVTLVPVYEIFNQMGMIDTLWPLVIRAFFGHPFLIFLLRQFYASIPRELEDAALIDGASRLDIFVRIILPLTKPAMATVAIFTFNWRWNDLFGAVIYLNSPENYTVAIGLSAFRGVYESSFHLLMAASVIVVLPTVLLFFFAQRFFIEGITLTGLKG